jgi:hypothetical protein
MQSMSDRRTTQILGLAMTALFVAILILNAGSY